MQLPEATRAAPGDRDIVELLQDGAHAAAFAIGLAAWLRREDIAHWLL